MSTRDAVFSGVLVGQYLLGLVGCLYFVWGALSGRDFDAHDGTIDRGAVPGIVGLALYPVINILLFTWLCIRSAAARRPESPRPQVIPAYRKSEPAPTVAGSRRVVEFTEGLPPPFGETFIFMLWDGSLTEGHLESVDGVRRLICFVDTGNPQGPQRLVMSTEKVLAHASIAPRR